METIGYTATTADDISSISIVQLDAALYANLAVYQSKETSHGEDSACAEYLEVAAPIRAQIRKLKRSQDKSDDLTAGASEPLASDRPRVPDLLGS